MTVANIRFSIIALLLLFIAAALGAILYLPVTAPQLELVDTVLGAMIGSLATAAGFYFRGS